MRTRNFRFLSGILAVVFMFSIGGMETCFVKAATTTDKISYIMAASNWYTYGYIKDDGTAIGFIYASERNIFPKDVSFKQITERQHGSGNYGVTTDKKVYSWNSASTGATSGEYVDGFENIDKIVNCESINSNSKYILALDQDGNVFGQGSNRYGQMGSDPSSNSSFAVPVQIQGLSDIKDISTADGTCAALDESGNVWVWGSNSYSRLGLDSSTSYLYEPRKIEGLSNVISISVGYRCVYAITADGLGYAWGTSYYGNLCDNKTLVTSTSGERITTPQQMFGISDGTQVVANQYGGFVIRNDGSTLSWGANGYYQLGDGSNVNRSHPELVNIPDLGKVVQIAPSGMVDISDGSGGRCTYFLDESGAVGRAGPTEVSILIEAPAAPDVTLSGTVAITGTAKYAQILTANTAGLTSTPPGSTLGTITYQWNKSNAEISGATGSTYTLVQDDIGETITVTVKAANVKGSKTSAPTDVIGKADQAAPALNYNISDGTVTITEVTNAEYKFASSSDLEQDWSTTNTYDFTEGALLTLEIRLPETSTHNASNVVTTTVDTDLPTPNAPDAFTLSYEVDVADTSYTVTIPEILGAEYSFDGTTWGSTRMTSGLPGQTIIGYARIAAVTNVSNTSEATSASVTLPLFQTGMPTASPNGGTFTTNISVTLSCPTADAAIYYTLDGAVPSVGSTLYAGALTISSTTTVKAIAVKSGMTTSPVMSVTFSQQDNSGGGGGGGGGGTSATIPAAEGSVNVEYQRSGEIVTLDVPESKVNEIINNTKNGIADFNLSGVRTATKTTIPKNALNKISNAGFDTLINMPQGTITLDNDALASVLEQSKGTSITIELEKLGISDLRAEQRSAARDSDVIFSISISSGSQEIKNFNGSLTISVPYTGPLPAVVWYLSETGELEKMDSAYDAATKTVTFTTTHLSIYVVGQDADTASPFTDITESAWYFNDVMYIFENGFMTGTNEDMFSPNMTLTRGMVVTILGRHSGISNIDSNSPFTDVDSNAYYAPYVGWASENGVVLGYGNGKFGPNDPITRQDMAVILMRYMDFKGATVPVTAQWIIFEDEKDIADYAMNAIQTLNKLSVINGVGDNKIDPKGYTTRAQAAAMLHRFMEII